MDGERLARLETQMIDVRDNVSMIATNVTAIRETLAEQRGAGKAIKAIYGVIITVLGFMGGLAGSSVKHF